MKNFLRLSVALNVLLVFFALYVLHRPHLAEISPPPPSVVVMPAAPADRPSVALPFRWNQLESTDYRTYIANLRGIGCPEQTIRDIITADVDEAFYAPRRDQLKPGRTAQDLESALQELNQQEAVLVSSLLGTQLPSTSVAAAADTVRVPRLQVNSQTERNQNQPASLPLALQPTDPAAMNLTRAQIQTINEIRQNFLDEIGETNQDPNDPAYRQRWQAAQREADDMLVGMLGRKFVISYQAQLENQAAEAR